MAKVHGHNSVCKINNVDLSAYIDSVTFTSSADTHDVTTMTNGAHIYGIGLTNAKVSVSGVYDSASTNTPRTVITALIGGAAVTLQWQPDGAGSGNAQSSAQVLCESYDETGVVADYIKWSSSWQVSGTVSYTRLTA